MSPHPSGGRTRAATHHEPCRALFEKGNRPRPVQRLPAPPRRRATAQSPIGPACMTLTTPATKSWSIIESKSMRTIRILRPAPSLSPGLARAGVVDRVIERYPFHPRSQTTFALTRGCHGDVTAGGQRCWLLGWGNKSFTPLRRCPGLFHRRRPPGPVAPPLSVYGPPVPRSNWSCQAGWPFVSGVGRACTRCGGRDRPP